MGLRFLHIILFLIFSEVGFSVTSTWTNANSTGLWSDPLNWSAGIPGASDDAVFNGTSTANCSIDVIVLVRSIDLQSGFTGSLVQTGSFTVNVGSSGFTVSDGRFIGSSGSIQLNNGNFLVDGGNFYSTTGELSFNRNFTISSGHFIHQNGTVRFNGSDHRGININVIDTFFNFLMAPTVNNRRLSINGTDTILVENKMVFSEGKMMNGRVHVLDSLVINAAYDLGTSAIHFRGNNHGHLLIEEERGQHDFFVEKLDITDTVFVTRHNLQPRWGNNRNLSVNSGVLSFKGNTSVRLNLDITINDGALAACECTTSMTRAFNNVGGKFLHNTGTWRWIFPSNVNYSSHALDTFYNVTFDQGNNRKLQFLGNDTMVVANKFVWNNGRFENGRIAVLDTFILNSGADDNFSRVIFSGSGNAHLISNSTDAGNLDVVVQKASISDTVWLLDQDGGILNVGTSDARIIVNQGVLAFQNENVNLFYEAIELNGGVFQAPTGVASVHSAFINNAGTFAHNQGTWRWVFGAHKDYQSNSQNPFFNMILNQSNNQRLEFTGADTMVVENKLEWNNGRFQNARIRVLDSLVLNAGADDNPTSIIFGGTGPGHLVSNSTDAGDVDIIIEKNANTDTVFLSDEDGGSANFGTNNANFTVNQGAVFILNPIATLNYSEIEMNGGALKATSGATRVRSAWDNNGGRLVHNNGIWDWRFTDHRAYRTVTTDTFFTVLMNANNNRRLEMNASEKFLVLNKMVLNNGRVNNGVIHIVDSLVVNAGTDAGNVDFHFVGAVNSHLVTNSAGSGIMDYFVNKTTSTDSVFIGDTNGGFVTFGLSGSRLEVNSGVVAWEANTTNSNVTLTELEINPSGSLQGPTGELRFNAIWDNNGGSYLHNMGTFVYRVSDHRNWNSANIDEFYNWSINTQSGDKHMYMGANDTIRVLNNVNFSNGRVNTGVILAEGDVTVTSAYANPNTQPTLVFSGSNSQVFDASGATGTFNGDIHIDKVSDTVTLASTVNIDHSGQELVFNHGIVKSSIGALFHFSNNSGSVSGGSELSFNKGPMRKTNNAAITFPTGDVNYGPIRLSNISGSSTSFRVQYFNRNASADGYNTDSLKTGLENVSNGEYWQVDRLATSNSASVTLFWDVNSGVADPADLVVSHFDNSTMKWESAGGNGITGDATSGSVRSNIWSDFSPFTLGSTTFGNVLPIELVYFQAQRKGNNVDLFWETATEQDNDYFEVERSTNGANWETVVFVPGAGTSASSIEYTDQDLDAPNVDLYYRLVQTDFDGTQTSSEVVFVPKQEEDQLNKVEISSFPNPVKRGSQVKLRFTNTTERDWMISLKDVSGREYLAEKITLLEGEEHSVIDIDETLPSGIYFVSSRSAAGNASTKLIIR